MLLELQRLEFWFKFETFRLDCLLCKIADFFEIVVFAFESGDAVLKVPHCLGSGCVLRYLRLRRVLGLAVWQVLWELIVTWVCSFKLFLLLHWVWSKRQIFFVQHWGWNFTGLDNELKLLVWELFWIYLLMNLFFHFSCWHSVFLPESSLKIWALRIW